MSPSHVNGVVGSTVPLRSMLALNAPPARKSAPNTTRANAMLPRRAFRCLSTARHKENVRCSDRLNRSPANPRGEDPGGLGRLFGSVPLDPAALVAAP